MKSNEIWQLQKIKQFKYVYHNIVLVSGCQVVCDNPGCPQYARYPFHVTSNSETIVGTDQQLYLHLQNWEPQMANNQVTTDVK